MKRKLNLYNMVIAIILLLIIVIGSLMLFVDPARKPARKIIETDNKEPAAASKPVFRKDGELRFIDSKTSEVITTIEIEVADDNTEREQGLMYRDTMADNAGMLFMMGTEQTQAFWMKNTIISLDILYVDSDRRIVSIHKNCIPYSLEQVVSEKPALFVVEVNAGFTEKYGIKAGDMISF